MPRDPRRSRPVVPDQLDLRDRSYLPSLRSAPPRRYSTLDEVKLTPLDQGATCACTGFALARVIDTLLIRSNRTQEVPVSPYMLYDMARRYDGFPGYRADSGSTLRGALKGWYRHGASRLDTWSNVKMPPANSDPNLDWWQDAARRPLGAYYRVDTRSVTDMQIALLETGALYASAVCHPGWDEGKDAKTVQPWVITHKKATAEHCGHAFVIVGYDERGFVLLNSWGRRWGGRGVAILTYDDWLDNAMDCWVAQLGVPTAQHAAVAEALSLRVSHRRVTLATDTTLRNRELSPFVVNAQNNGELSERGEFRTKPGDLDALANLHLPEAIRIWKLPETDPVDIAIYAHGGLVGEQEAAEAAALWIPALYEAKVFPIFLMWETDALSTIKNRLADLVQAPETAEARPTAGVRDQLERFLNQRLERLFSEPGAVLWDEMKQNAAANANNRRGGLRQLCQALQSSPRVGTKRMRLHLIGHSAGSIVRTHLATQLVADGWTVASMVFMAPAVRCDVFDATVRPLLGGRVKRLAQYYLDDTTEQKDPTCRVLLGYSRSLLYLVSESFEHGRRVPILGMAKYFDAGYSTLAHTTAVAAPGRHSESTTHGGFDDDGRTRESVIKFIKE